MGLLFAFFVAFTAVFIDRYAFRTADPTLGSPARNASDEYVWAPHETAAEAALGRFGTMRMEWQVRHAFLLSP